ncbi:hypothetical protein P7C71_g5716, partial [Lecanoromycetidae sp. Uapishka_2]
MILRQWLYLFPIAPCTGEYILGYQQPPLLVGNDERAASAIAALQQWYNKESGLWDTTGWWNSANVLTVLADFTSIDDSSGQAIRNVFDNTFVQAQLQVLDFVKIMTPKSINTYHKAKLSSVNTTDEVTGFHGFLNEYYDDEGWWALAWLKVYDLTKQERYLQMAIEIFEDMKAGWGGECGGLWWNKEHTYTGAIENGLFLALAAQLANRAANEEYYIQWALKQWGWFQQTGMINAQYNINNGIDPATCRNDGGTIWTYNQGVILGALVELNKAAPDKSYLEMAGKIASAALEKLCDSNGILHEPCEPNCGADGPQFKGIFMRNLWILHKAQPNHRFKIFIEENADSIWHNARGIGDLLGLVWSGPFTSATASTQSSACDALVAALYVG